MQITEIHISEVRPGDTIVHAGHHKTVGRGDITHCDFFGTKVFGDSWNLGYSPVQKVTFAKFLQGERVA